MSPTLPSWFSRQNSIVNEISNQSAAWSTRMRRCFDNKSSSCSRVKRLLPSTLTTTASANKGEGWVALSWRTSPLWLLPIDPLECEGARSRFTAFDGVSNFSIAPPTEDSPALKWGIWGRCGRNTCVDKIFLCIFSSTKGLSCPGLLFA